MSLLSFKLEHTLFALNTEFSLLQGIMVCLSAVFDFKKRVGGSEAL